MFEPEEIPKDAEGERTCGACLERKPTSAFYKDGKDPEGNVRYRRDCKECYRVSRLRSRRPIPKKKGRRK